MANILQKLLCVMLDGEVARELKILGSVGIINSVSKSYADSWDLTNTTVCNSSIPQKLDLKLWIKALVIQPSLDLRQGQLLLMLNHSVNSKHSVSQGILRKLTWYKKYINIWHQNLRTLLSPKIWREREWPGAISKFPSETNKGVKCVSRLLFSFLTSIWLCNLGWLWNCAFPCSAYSARVESGCLCMELHPSSWPWGIPGAFLVNVIPLFLQGNRRVALNFEVISAMIGKTVFPCLLFLTPTL